MKNNELIMGWDIGGAHVKACLLEGGTLRWAEQRACPLWQGMQHLEQVLRELRELAPNVSQNISHAVTMTGELVDLFASREEGVRAIVHCFTQHFPNAHFFAGELGFVNTDEACMHFSQVASANWLATAKALQTKRDDLVVLLDIGSTTTDIIALSHDRIYTQGTDDFTRLSNDELLYTGCVRTPLMALAQRIAFEGVTVNVMAEYFATTADVYRLSGELDEAYDQHPAADNSEKTPLASARRIARMVGRDVESASLNVWRGLAQAFAAAQEQLIMDALQRLCVRLNISAMPRLVVTGCGAFIGEKLVKRMGLRAEKFSDVMQMQAMSNVDTCAPAVAVAILLSKRL